LSRFFYADFCSSRTSSPRKRSLTGRTILPRAFRTWPTITPGLVDPWGIAFLSGQPFFLADNKVGHVTAHDASGVGVRLGSFTVPNSAGTGFDTPTAIVADQNSFFGSSSLVKPFILVTGQGTIFTWGPDAHHRRHQPHRDAKHLRREASVLDLWFPKKLRC